jgi:hypothetical protein
VYGEFLHIGWLEWGEGEGRRVFERRGRKGFAEGAKKKFKKIQNLRKEEMIKVKLLFLKAD